MSDQTSSSDSPQLQKNLNLLGLKLTDSELNEVQVGSEISLEDRSLGEIGSVFILAAALSAANSKNPRKPVTFRDLIQSLNESNDCQGIPIVCWNCSAQGRRCLYLTFSEGKPTLRTAYGH